MTEFSDYLEDALLNHTLRNTALTVITTAYLALYTTDPTDADVGTEVANANGYAREAMVFNVPAGGVCTLNTQIDFTAAGGNWGTVTHIGIHDNGGYGLGNLLYHTPLTTSRTVDDGDTLSFAATTGVTVTLS